MSEEWGEPDDDWGSESEGVSTALLATLSIACCGAVLVALLCSGLRRAPWRPLMLLWAAAEMLLQLQVLAGWITLKVSVDPRASTAGCGLHHMLSHAAGLALSWAAALLAADRLVAARAGPLYARRGAQTARLAAGATALAAANLFLPFVAVPAADYWHGRFACQVRAPQPWPRLLDALLDAYLVLAVLLPPLATAACLAAARGSAPAPDAAEYGSLTPFLATYCALELPSVAFAVWVLAIEHAGVGMHEGWAAVLLLLLLASQYASLVRAPLLLLSLVSSPQFRRALRGALAPAPRVRRASAGHMLVIRMDGEEEYS